jgi:predicted CXXCH cytochrome family protein
VKIERFAPNQLRHAILTDVTVWINKEAAQRVPVKVIADDDTLGSLVTFVLIYFLPLPIVLAVHIKHIRAARFPRAFAACALFLFAGLAWALPHAVGQTEVIRASGTNLPAQLKQNERFASSGSCRECHPDQHKSWHRTYHRTMTQTASPDNFVGAFDGQRIDSKGLVYRVFKRDEQFWAEMPDPDEMINRQRTYDLKMQSGLATEPLRWDNIPKVERQVVMSTGSHHYQTYWVESAKYPGTMMTLPLVYLIRDKRWIPREAAFMFPPGPRRMVTVWNDHCISCHSTGPAPKPYDKRDTATRRILETGFQSQVGEIGIACEACHGPAQEHLRLRRADSLGKLPAASQKLLLDDPIIQPEHLSDHRRSAYICGQCHGAYIRSEGQVEQYRDKGIDFVPGEDLLTKRQYIFPPQDKEFYPNERARLDAIEAFTRNKEFFQQRFWDNGLVLAGGREFTAMAVSKCFTKGAITCLSCHSMHGSDPSGQLKAGMNTSAACTQCHDDAQYTTAVAEHTHHREDSSGSNCLNCHMPRTTYALFRAISSHQIQSPDLAGSVEHGVPNACNLCHLDKSLNWTQSHLAEWYGYERHKLSAEQAQISAALLWMLKGHAAQRVIVAWHAGWKPAQDVSGADWLAPYLARLLDDPYGVIRYVAGHSLTTLPHFERFDYDFLGSETELARAADAATHRWRGQQNAPPSRTGREVLITKDGQVADPAVKWLIDRRDNRHISIQE